MTFVFWSRQDLLCGISDIVSRQIIWGLLKFFLRSSRKISQQKCANHKIVHFVSYFHIFMSIVYTCWTFFDFCDLVLAQALRDRRNFFSTNNLRLVKIFIEIINEALTAKNEQITKSCILSHDFHVFMSNYIHILNVSRLLWFGTHALINTHTRNLGAVPNERERETRVRLNS